MGEYNMELPWSEDYMLRQSHPAYDAWCRDDEDEPSDYTKEDYEADRADDAWHEKGLYE